MSETTATILVTGGAGYVGSHTVRALTAAGYRAVAYDDLSAGNRPALPADVELIEGTLQDEAKLRAVLATHQPAAIIHFAGKIEVGESMSHPRRFYDVNVVGALNLLNAALDFGKPPIVFSSSAGVYGQQEVIPIPEDAIKRPSSVYGATKLYFEEMLQAYAAAYGLSSISLRYFNVCGALESGEIGEAHPNKTHLIELALLAALGKRDGIKVFGSDYPTPDGTCIRDYIHVVDLADAHVLAVNKVLAAPICTAYNVGLGHGFSVKEVLDACDRISGITIKRENAPRRAGDPPALVADNRRILAELGWRPQYDHLDRIVESAWRWHSTHPDDFAG
jgi:UDP-glucose 4-epimerase